MIHRRRGADTHEFFGADLNHRHARFIVEMGNDVIRHGSFPAVLRCRNLPAIGGDCGGNIPVRPQSASVREPSVQCAGIRLFVCGVA
jgi:hypothetical protein